MRNAVNPVTEIVLVGATSRTGRAIAEGLASRWRVIGVARSADKLALVDALVERRQSDFTSEAGLRTSLQDAKAVVVCTKPRFIAQIIAAIPRHVDRVVIVGSTRRYSEQADPVVAQLRGAEDAFARSGLPGVILHPTMIYGAAGENNIQRVAAFLRRCSVVPLPMGLRSRIQMIHVADVARCVEAALERATAPGPPIVIAGPEAVSYRQMIRAVAQAVGRPVHIVPLPLSLMLAGLYLARLLTNLPRFEIAEVLRLSEDKSFALDDMHRRLGVRSRSLAEGLAETFRGSSERRAAADPNLHRRRTEQPSSSPSPPA